MTEQPNPKNSAWRSPWFLGWMSLLVFVLIMNLTMAYFSITKKPRLLTKDFYEKGKAYSDNRLKLEAERLRWSSKVEQPDSIPLSEESTFGFYLFNDQQQRAKSEVVIFYAYRPSDGSFDFSKPMEEESDGYYKVSTKFPLKGIWDIIISTQKGQKEYNTAFNIIVRDTEN